MNDIYEQKANKYKYKYYKLKQEYIAEGGGGMLKGYTKTDIINDFFWSGYRDRVYRSEQDKNMKKHLESQALKNEQEQNKYNNLTKEQQTVFNKLNDKIHEANVASEKQGYGHVQTKYTVDTFLQQHILTLAQLEQHNLSILAANRQHHQVSYKTPVQLQQEAIQRQQEQEAADKQRSAAQIDADNRKFANMTPEQRKQYLKKNGAMFIN
jgi:hypothetical protein